MKKIIDLIKNLLFGNGSVAEKIEEVTQLETAVAEEVKVVEEKVKEVKATFDKGFAEVKALIESRNNASHTALISAAGSVIVALVGEL